VWGMVAAFALVLTAGLRVPPLRLFFAAELPRASVWGVVAACLAGGILALLAVRRIPWLARRERP
jgi:hypothetical protein